MIKKIACALLALLLLAAYAGTALAATVSYQDGKLTISHSEGFFMILIDGANANKWVGAGMPTVTFDYPLEEGREHQLVLLSLTGDGDIGAMESFWAGPAPTPSPAPTVVPDQEPTAEPTEAPTAAPTAEPSAEPTETPAPAITGPLRIDSVSYDERVLTLTVSGLRGYAEIWLDGANTGSMADQNGVFALNRGLTAGNHTVSLYDPINDEIAQADFYARFFPDPALLEPARLGALLKNDADGEIPFTVSYAGDEHGAALIITPAAENGEADESLSLYLTGSLTDSLKKEGFGHVSLALPGAELGIDLNAVAPSWFATDKAIWYYIFSLTPAGNGKIRVNVSAQTSVAGRMDAGFYSGVTLIRNGQISAVFLNGIY